MKRKPLTLLAVCLSLAWSLSGHVDAQVTEEPVQLAQATDKRPDSPTRQENAGAQETASPRPGPEARPGHDAPPPEHRPEREGDRKGPPPPLTAKQIETALEIIREQNPRLAERLDQARKEHPDRMERAMAAQWPRLAKLADLKDRDPELFTLAIKDIRLSRRSVEEARKCRRAQQDNDQPALEVAQRELIGLQQEQFAVRQAMRKHELARLEQRLKELEALQTRAEALREKLRTPEDQRDQLIEQRVKEFLSSNGEPQTEL